MLTENSKSCELSAEIVAYMYDELSLDARDSFERHLADCTRCIDEFAEVSNARYAVYEWHKEAFEPLATPQFSIPYRPVPVVSEPRRGWFEALVGMLAIGRTPVFAAATVLVIFGLGFAAFVLTRGGDREVAGNAVPKAIATPMPIQPSPITVAGADRTDEATPKPERAVNEPRVRELRPTYAADRKRVPVKTPTPARYAQKAPKLTDMPDDEDRSLRLADLFDGIGG